jgi:glycosyltransferase involved in cell wall biosynthesis
MKIAYLVSQYPAISHTFILREVRGLRALGQDICVASINPPDREQEDLTHEEAEEAAKTYYVKLESRHWILFQLLSAMFRTPVKFLSSLWFTARLGGTDTRQWLYGAFYFLEAILVARWMASERADHLHVHFATPASTVAMIASRLSGIPFSMTVHGPDEFYDASRYQLTAKIREAAFILCISSFCRSQLMKLSEFEQWHKFEICRLGVDPDRFRPAHNVSPTGGEFELLCVGRLTPAKGQHVLVEAAANLIQEGHPVLVRLVGDGPDRKSLERLARKRRMERHVVFEGAVNQDRIRNLYEAADVFVLPSFAEGIPVVLMEAMAMEKPCVSTRITGIPELIENEADGLLVPASDAEALTTALGRLIFDGRLCRRLATEGRQKVCDRYNLEQNLVQLQLVFQRRLRQPVTSAVGSKRPVMELHNAA